METDQYGTEFTTYPFVAKNTVDGKIHLIYFDKELNYNAHRTITGTTVSGVIAEIPLALESNSLTSVSNDLFLVRNSNPNFVVPLIFRHYDAAPLAPTNLAVSSSVNYHPYITWNRNPEPDLNHYVVEKYVSQDQGWINLGQTSNLYFEDQSECYCHVPPPQLCPAGHTVYYRIKAIDVQSHISNASNSIGTVVQGGLPYKIVGEEAKPEEYNLSQNYPNPFNPTTKINYALQEDAKVQIKVYDMLGTEVAELVNDTKPAGFYETAFDASDLSSGVYIYRITALSGERILFSQSKQMILLK